MPNCAQYQSTVSPSLQLHLVRADGRRRAVDLEDPARGAGGGIEADLVDVAAELRAGHVVVELAGDARALERLERVRRRSGAAASRRRSSASCPPRACVTRAARPPERRRARRQRGREERRRGTPGHRILLPRGVRVLAARGRSSDSGRPLRRLPGRSQWRRGGGHLPSQRRDRPGLAPGSLSASPVMSRRRAYHRPVRASGRDEALTRWLPVVALGSPDLRALVDPQPGHRPRLWDLVLRKLAHAAEYAVLAVSAAARARLGCGRVVRARSPTP